MIPLVTYYVNCSAVGDTVCAVPAVAALIRDQRLYKALGSQRTCEILRLCGIDDEYIVEINSTEDLAAFDPKGSTMVAANTKGRAGYRIHLVDLFTVFSINAILKPEEKWVLAKPELFPKLEDKEWGPYAWGDYVVIGVGYAMLSRKLPLKVYTEIVKNCRKKGLNVVLLGSQRKNSKKPISFDGYPDENCINLIDQTTIAESVAIMSMAKCVIGVDSGLIYLASLTEVPIVCGFTFVDPYYRMPFRRGSLGWNFYPIEPKGPCKYCSNRLAMFGVEFDSACPYGFGFSCATSLDPKDYLKALKKVL